MKRYIVRIQLNHAHNPDYKLIHDAMKKINFFRYIKDSTNKWFHLTTAMYYGTASLDVSQMLDHLHKLIVTLYSKENDPPTNHEILVVQESSIDWRLFLADKSDPEIPPVNKYLVAVI